MTIGISQNFEKLKKISSKLEKKKNGLTQLHVEYSSSFMKTTQMPWSGYLIKVNLILTMRFKLQVK